jgi:NADP-dependent 3-hydroxy acid dehydrogenase YdfG
MTSAVKKSVLLTGASRGIGLAIAKSLLNDGHNVFAVARTSGALEELKKEAPGQVEFLAGDVADEEVCLFHPTCHRCRHSRK